MPKWNGTAPRHPVGGGTNWAGYFSEGNVYVNNQLRIGSGAKTINSAFSLAASIIGELASPLATAARNAAFT